MKNIIPFAALIAVAWWVFISQATLAFGGEWRWNWSRAEVQAAVEAQDYSLIPTDLQERITAERFADMIERSAEK